MKTLVIYDVQDDRIRTKVFEACKDYGLQHIQYSAFLGELNHNRREELWERLKRTLIRHTARVFMVPLCDKDLRLARELYIGPEGTIDV
jgi:CRISPR-associated protein Cas2